MVTDNAKSCRRTGFFSKFLLIQQILTASGDHLAGRSFCDTPQYSKIGYQGLIRCHIASNFSTISWYKDVNHTEVLLITLDGKGETQRQGHYSVTGDGSLIFQRVTIQDDGNYTLLIVDTTDNVLQQKVSFVAVVPPQDNQPHINVCGLHNSCLADNSDITTITCYLDNVRPAASLTWYLINAKDETRLLSVDVTLPGDSYTYSTSSTIVVSLLPTKLMQHFRCKAGWPSRKFEVLSANVIIDNSKKTSLNETKVTAKSFRTESLQDLHCGNVGETVDILVWKKKSSGNVFKTIAYSFFDRRQHYVSLNPTFKILNGIMVIGPITQDHQGDYLCMASEGIHQRYAFLHLHVHSDRKYFCEETQYAEIGERGQILCNFPSDFVAVYWYHELNGTFYPLIIFEKGRKTVNAYYEGKLDVLENASMVINKVTFQDEKNYKVDFLDVHDKVFTFEVHLVVTVKPDQPHPLIYSCEDTNFCFKAYKDNECHVCSIKNTKPAMQLNWYRLYFGKEESLKALIASSSRNSSTHSTTATICNAALPKKLLQLLICKATWPVPNSQPLEAHVLVDASSITLNLTTMAIRSKDVIQNFKTSLSCSKKATYFLFMWKKRDFGLSYFSPLVYMYYKGNTTITVSNSQFNFQESSLTINAIRREHEGTYLCLSSDGANAEYAALDVIVLIPPDPPYITVEQCNDTGDICVIRKQKGSIACFVSRVYPKVSLDVIARERDQIEFFNIVRGIQEEGNVFNSFVRAEYLTNRAYRERKITISCLASGKGSLTFNQERVMYIQIPGNGIETPFSNDGATSMMMKWMVGFIAFVAVAVVVVVLVILAYCQFGIRA